jgi:putative NIF3 family GTP cyclohydrolase 1 type 2
MSIRLTRREFAALAGSGVAATVVKGQTASLTAGQVVDRIKQNIGVPWNDKTYRDTYKIGGPDVPVRGIASTFMSNLDVLQRAHRVGLNMVVTHEPTFWSDNDSTDKLVMANDPLYHLKREFAEKNGIVVWRFHDHWHARKPDGIFEGWNAALGWTQYLTPGNTRQWTILPAKLDDVARHVATSLKTGGMRIIGDPNLMVSKVGRGAHTLAGNMGMLPKVDLLITSEAREWDSIEYVRDAVLSGQKKGMLLISHEAGEEAGMDNCAKWLRGFVHEVPVQFIATGDQFWRPA